MRSIFETIDEIIDESVIVDNFKHEYNFNEADSVGHISAMAESAFLSIKLEFVEQFSYVDESALFNESAGILNEGFNPFKFLGELFSKMYNALKAVIEAIFRKSDNDSAQAKTFVKSVEKKVQTASVAKPTDSKPKPTFIIPIPTGTGKELITSEQLFSDINNKVEHVAADKANIPALLGKVEKEFDLSFDHIEKVDITKLSASEANKFIKNHIGDPSKIQTSFGKVKLNKQMVVAEEVEITFYLNKIKSYLDRIKTKEDDHKKVFDAILVDVKSLLDTTRIKAKEFEEAVASANEKANELSEKGIEQGSHILTDRSAVMKDNARKYGVISIFYKSIGSSINDYVSTYTKAQSGVMTYYSDMRKDLLNVIANIKASRNPKDFEKLMKDPDSTVII